MTAQTPGTSSGWTVTGQRPGQQVDSNMRVIDGYYVDYVTGNGVAGSLWVTQRDYTPEKVRALIAEQAATHDAVFNLTDKG